MNLEITSLRNLVAALDDAQRLQDGVSCNAIQPYLQKLFTRLARVHDRAAGDFVAWVFQAGGSAPRGGSPLGALRARDAAWKVRVSLDPEMVCMALAEKSEARVLRRFRAAATRLHDSELCNQVQTHRREIEHLFMQLNSFGYVMRTR
ncbi:MAG: hypothetical protein EPN40_06810 [Rhodanobacteraceae bacterium]|nr:MAG: hypothetical protein EPN40_06810 [Rhodanobacteraceae bacterium]